MLELIRLLQQDLEILEDFAKKCQLNLNFSKCTALSVREKGSAVEYYLHGAKINNTDSYTYLGIQIQYDIKFSNHYDKILRKATRTLGMLCRVLKHADTKTRQISYLFWSKDVWSGIQI